jgi:hypothetical protein
MSTRQPCSLAIQPSSHSRVISLTFQPITSAWLPGYFAVDERAAGDMINQNTVKDAPQRQQRRLRAKQALA